MGSVVLDGVAGDEELGEEAEPALAEAERQLLLGQRPQIHRHFRMLNGLQDWQSGVQTQVGVLARIRLDRPHRQLVVYWQWNIKSSGA